MQTMNNSLAVRPARLDDQAAVVAFCRNTFSWGDYIADTFARWTQDAHGKLLVATLAGQPVGILHIAFLGNAVAWLEGMRVHPDHRRRGIGTRMDAAARQAARAHGCRAAQLVTGMKNIAAQKTLDTEGYQRVAQFNEWQAEPLSEKFSARRVGTHNDAPTLLAQWNQSEMRQASHHVLPDLHWHWSALDAARWRAHLTANQVRVAADGFAIVAASDEPAWNGLHLLALAGQAETLFALARDARCEAAYRGYAHVEANLANAAPLNAALARAGYHSDGGTFLYEQIL